MGKKNKLLVVVPGMMPTVEIITRTLLYLESYNIKIVFDSHLPLKDIFSGEYKLLFIRQYSPALKPLLLLLQRFNIQYLYFLDDNFWEIKHNAQLAHHYKNTEVLTEFVKNASCVITPSEYLSEYVKRFNSNVVSVKAAFSFNLLDGLTRYPTDRKIKILYAGSPYRDQDFYCVVPALQRILQDYPEVEAHFYGYFPNELQAIQNVIFHKTSYGYEDYIKKQYQENYTIGLAPLAYTESNLAKSNLKYREYGACSIAGIYTNQPPYANCIEDKQNGLLVDQTIESWYNAMQELIEKPSLRKKIAENAREDLHLHYTHEKIVPVWQAILDRLPYNAVINAKRMVFYYKFVALKTYCMFLRYKIQRVRDYYRSNGFSYTCKKIMRTLLSYA